MAKKSSWAAAQRQMQDRAITVALSVPAPLLKEARERLYRAVHTGASCEATIEELRRVFAGYPATGRGSSR